MGLTIDAPAAKTAPKETIEQKEVTLTQRLAYTFLPVFSAAKDFTTELIDGKNIYEAADEVGDTFKAVYNENSEQIKENIHKSAEQVKKVPYGFGLIGIIPRWLDFLVNE